MLAALTSLHGAPRRALAQGDEPPTPIASVGGSDGDGPLIAVVALLALLVLRLGGAVPVLWRRQGNGGRSTR